MNTCVLLSSIDYQASSSRTERYYTCIVDVQLQKPSDDIGKEYVTFVEENLDKLRESITDEIFTLQLFEARSHVTCITSLILF